MSELKVTIKFAHYDDQNIIQVALSLSTCIYCCKLLVYDHIFLRRTGCHKINLNGQEKMNRKENIVLLHKVIFFSDFSLLSAF